MAGASGAMSLLAGCLMNRMSDAEDSKHMGMGKWRKEESPQGESKEKSALIKGAQNQLKSKENQLKWK